MRCVLEECTTLVVRGARIISFFQTIVNLQFITISNLFYTSVTFNVSCTGERCCCHPRQSSDTVGVIMGEFAK